MLGSLIHLLVLFATAVPVVDVESIVRENDHSVVVITGVRESNGNSVQGSGVCISAEGHMLATAHQVGGVVGLQARFFDGSRFPLVIVEVLPELELALLKAEGDMPGVARIGDANTLRSGSPLVAIAAPQNLEFSTITGIVSSVNRTFKDMPVVQTNLQVDSGASGGPVFDQYGQLIGIIMLNLIEAQYISAINPINNAFPLLERHGLQRAAQIYEDDAGYELVPVVDISERELRAIEAYNQGVSAADLEAKLRAYTLSVTLLPAFFEGWFNLAVTQTKAGNTTEALNAYQQALELREDSLAVHRNMGRIHLLREDFAAAQRAFMSALQLAPGEAQSYNDLGEAFRRAKETEKAVSAFEAALSIRPNYPSAMYNLALTHVGAGNRNAALAFFEQYLEAASEASDAGTVRQWIKELKSEH